MADIHRDVIIVGGGFGGYYAAHELTSHDIPVSLIDTHGKQTFQPLLYQAATGLIDPDTLDFSFARMDKVTAIADRVVAVDLANREVTTANGEQASADHLVLATGATVNFYGIPGAAEHSYPLYTGAHARAIKARLQELGPTVAGPIQIVVVGAGATGVEISGALTDVVTKVLPRTFPELDSRSINLHLVDQGEAPLAAMAAESQQFAAEELSEAGVQLHFGHSVSEVTESEVRFEDDSSLPSHLTIWAGGLSVSGPAMDPEPKRGHGGRYQVDESLRLPGFDNVFCVGDAAISTEHPLPQLGSVAKQQGTHVGRAIRRQRKGNDPGAFRYRDMGDMAMVRHNAAVVEIGKQHHVVTGTPAFFMWLGLHAYLLPGERHRVEAVRDWMHTLRTGKSNYLGS